MRKNTIIEHDTFKQIIQYKEAVTGSAARNHLKMELLNSIITAIGEKWFRMKSETRSALEYLCFLSIERGFVYAGSQHVSERHDIDSSTVRRYILHLEKQGVIKRLWRSSTKHNGRGQAVIFFTEHPYYEKYWQSMFFSTNNAQADAQSENCQNASQINEDERKIVSTVDKPYISKNLLNKRNDNVQNENLDGSYTSSRVPKEFRNLVKCFYDDFRVIEELWKVIQIQTYYLSYYTQQDKLNLAINSFKQLIRNIKQGRKVRNIFGYFWGIVDRKLDEEYKSILFEVV